MNWGARMSGSPTLNRIQTDLKVARNQLAIARQTGDLERAGELEAEVARLEDGERRAQALMRGRKPYPYRRRAGRIAGAR